MLLQSSSVANVLLYPIGLINGMLLLFIIEGIMSRIMCSDVHYIVKSKGLLTIFLRIL